MEHSLFPEMMCIEAWEASDTIYYKGILLHYDADINIYTYIYIFIVESKETTLTINAVSWVYILRLPPSVLVLFENLF